MAERNPFRKGLLICLSLSFLTLSGCASTSFVESVSGGGGIVWNDTRWCVPWGLRSVLRGVSRRFGRVRVTSTHRFFLENAFKGGAWGSYHVSCRAVDFRVNAPASQVLRYLRSRWEVGGYARYGNGIFHIDNGPRRTW